MFYKVIRSRELFTALMLGLTVLMGVVFTKNATAASGYYLVGYEPLSIDAVSPVNQLGAGNVDLGTVLYFDVSLSKAGIVNCISCHDLTREETADLSASNGNGWQIESKMRRESFKLY